MEKRRNQALHGDESDDGNEALNGSACWVAMLRYCLILLNQLDVRNRSADLCFKILIGVENAIFYGGDRMKGWRGRFDTGKEVVPAAGSLYCLFIAVNGA